MISHAGFAPAWELLAHRVVAGTDEMMGMQSHRKRNEMVVEKSWTAQNSFLVHSTTFDFY